MGTPSPKHTPEFKRRAVEPYRSKQPTTYAAAARELGVDPGSLSDWGWVSEMEACRKWFDLCFNIADRIV